MKIGFTIIKVKKYIEELNKKYKRNFNVKYVLKNMGLINFELSSITSLN